MELRKMILADLKAKEKERPLSAMENHLMQMAMWPPPTFSEKVSKL